MKVFNQPNTSYIKTCDSARKIAIDQGDYYTTGCLYLYFKE